MEELNKKGKKEEKISGTRTTVVIAGGGGVCREVEEGRGGRSGDGGRLDFGW